MLAPPVTSSIQVAGFSPGWILGLEIGSKLGADCQPCRLSSKGMNPEIRVYLGFMICMQGVGAEDERRQAACYWHE